MNHHQQQESFHTTIGVSTVADDYDDDDDFYQALSSFYECDASTNTVSNNSSDNFTIIPSNLNVTVVTNTSVEQQPCNILTTSFTEETGDLSHKIVNQVKSNTPPKNKPKTAVAISSVTGRPLYPRQRHTGNTRCSNCNIDHTPMWRKGLQGEILCNKCGLYLTRHGKERPLKLQDNSDETCNLSNGQTGKKSNENSKKERKKCEKHKTKRSLESIETKAKKKIKSTIPSIDQGLDNNSQPSPILNAIFASNHTCKLTNPNQTVSNQLLTSPTANSYWSVVNESPVNQGIVSPISVTTSQPPVMIKTDPQVSNNMPNDWILSQLSTCSKPVIRKQVWPCYTIQQSVPNTVFYSSEPLVHPPFQCNLNNSYTTTKISSPEYQSEDQLLFNLFIHEQQDFMNQQVTLPQTFNPYDSLLMLKFDQNEFISELFSNYQ